MRDIRRAYTPLASLEVFILSCRIVPELTCLSPAYDEPAPSNTRNAPASRLKILSWRSIVMSTPKMAHANARAIHTRVP